MSTRRIDGIGLLVTNTDDGRADRRPRRGRRRPCRRRRHRAGAAADERIDAGGRCVIPGFVDSHTHLVFAGDRSAEFAARMAGAPYEAGGINVTIDATRAAADDELRDARRGPARPRPAGPGITTVEIKSGYGGDRRRRGPAARASAGELTAETTFLGAHVVPPEFDGRPTTTSSSSAARCSPPCAPHARWIDAFCERGAFDADQCRPVLEAGRAAGLGLRLHANQLGPGPGVQLAVELGCASADHCTYLSDADVEALAGERHRGDVPPGDRLLDPPAVSRRPPGHRRRGDRRPGHQLQPGVELHDVDVVRHRPRRARPAG